MRTDSLCYGLERIEISSINSIASLGVITGGDDMRIDIEKIRKDLIENAYGAFYIGGFGGAINEVNDIKNMPPEKLIELAIEQGLDLTKYQY